MKKTVAIAILAALVLLAGCVPSIHELYTRKTKTWDPALLGIWQGSEPDEIWTFEEGDDRTYILSIVQKDSGEVRISEFDVTLVNLYGDHYMDWFPAENELPEPVGDVYRFHLLPVHTFVKVHATDPNLTISLMDPDKVEDLLTDNPDLVKHEVRDDRLILTADPEALQSFLRNPKAAENIWTDPVDLKRLSNAPGETK